MSNAAALPEQGQLVDVRQRRWVIADVAKSNLPVSPLHPLQKPQHLVSLSSVEDDALGEELQVIWELELGTHIHEKVALPEPTGFDPPVRLDAFLDAVRWGAASTADIHNIQAPFRSGIEVHDYQLDPVVRAIQMPRVSLLIADDVGLGKTIEAGLVCLELLIRHRARKILIVCPASLQIQWRDQMRDKFGLDFRIVDSELLRTLRRSRGLHVNPWTHFPRLITSIDFLKRERPLRLFREALPAQGQPTYPRRFDLLLADEVHNIAPAGGGCYATDSQRTEAIRLLAPHFEHKLFLTATPHNGYSESFSALLELLDNQRFARGVLPDRQQLGAVMVRRMKSELKDWSGSRRFPERKLEAIEVAYTEEERRIHTALRKYTELRQQNASSQEERFATEFVLKLLKKRLFSSPAAFASTLEQHERSLREARKRQASVKPSLGVLQREIGRVDEDYADDNELEDTAGDVVDTASRLFREPTAEEMALLREMKAWAASASARPDSKTAELIRWLQAVLRPGGKWSNERVILFTEYRATQNWLQTLLASEGFAGDRLMTLYGGMDRDERERIKAAFQYDPTASPVRILLATDAASEGIDLQNHCHRLVHCEIPWNPNRMEQRNGRIDRHGQRASEVLIYHFVGKGYKERERGLGTPPGELEADLEFLMRASIKVNNIREDLGKVGPVIAQQVEEAMLGRRTTLHTEKAEKEAEPVRKMLKFERDLQAQIARLRDQFFFTRKELRLTPDNIQAVVEAALELAGQPPLLPAEVAGIWPDPSKRRTTCPVFHLPALKASWATCSQGLNHPHTGEQRPIVFDHDLAVGRDDVVVAHLNHRLVQMSLRLLREEVWSREGRKKLHRVAARLVPNHALEHPAMIAHARLVVIGGDSHRLHEEIITAGGFIREGRFARMNVGQVQEALAASLPGEPVEGVKQRLVELWPRHSASLIQALEARMRDRTSGLQKELAERAKKEEGDIRAILTELQKTIQAELNEPAYVQMELFSDPEREQLERNRDALRARVKQIPEEIDKETAAVRARFDDPQPRLFPVAVTYLVPMKLAADR
jgi:superfamily II DNA or RNA helicase